MLEITLSTDSLDSALEAIEKIQQAHLSGELVLKVSIADYSCQP
ncbi:hypothetical protein BN1356_00961 [Streptococcus varani]|uniref:Uncharacterized protein n=1 Tax=Streptococcus varani TaxID=1608583 RepID=A0A0E4H466_9STRE|nr:hypothetical protein [Streptococcus varani]CQR24617.1 hypothetical protein BN1356_00961 [Streptococcus varani]